MGSLLESDYEFISAMNGQEGIEQYTLHQKNIKLVFTDFEMPMMNGPELAKEIRRLEQIKNQSFHVPIIGLTGHDSKEQF